MGTIVYYDGTKGVTTNTVGTSGQLLVSAGTGTPIFQASGLQQVAISPTVASSPYVVGSTTEYFIPVDTSAARTIQLPDAPTIGRVYVVKDATGTAATFNISVTTVGGVVTIDGAATYTMNVNYQSARFIFNGTSYYVF